MPVIPVIMETMPACCRNFTVMVKVTVWWLWLIGIAFLLAFNESAGKVIPFNTALPLEEIWRRVDLVAGFREFFNSWADWITVVGSVMVTAVFAHGRSRILRWRVSLFGMMIPLIWAAFTEGLAALPAMLLMYLFCAPGTLLNLASLPGGKMDGEDFQDAGLYFSALFLWLMGCAGVGLMGWVLNIFRQSEVLGGEIKAGSLG